MYLGRLKSLLASGQVSQYIPRGTATTFSTEGTQQSTTLNLPSRKRQFRLGRGKTYISAFLTTGSIQENHKLDCVDLTTSTLGSSLWTTLNQKGHFSNSGTAGYYAGGTDSGGTAQTTIQKITYSTDTVSTPGAVMSGGGRIMACGNNNTVAGYMLGSALGSLGTAINKLVYSNDTRSTLSATVSQARYGDDGFSNSGTATYRCFGEG
jgi:hypothetical protein